MKQENQMILITGAASGLGKLATEKLLKQKAVVIALDVNVQGLKNLQEEFAEYSDKQNTKLFTYVCDLSQKNQIDKVSKQILTKHKKIDVLVNNAGIVSGKPFLDLSDNDIQKSLDINLMANIWLTKAFLPSMTKANNGQVVFISSAAGIIGVNKLSDYCASKFAVFGFAESLRVEMKKIKSNVKISIVAPYYIKTGMFQGVQTRFSFLLPLLEPQYAANKIVKTIEYKKPLTVIPNFVRALWFARLLGTKMFDAIANAMGVNQTMQHFTGREKPKPQKATVKTQEKKQSKSRQGQGNKGQGQRKGRQANK